MAYKQMKDKITLLVSNQQQTQRKGKILTETSLPSVPQEETKKDVFSNVNRLLDDKDLTKPAVGRMLLDKLEIITKERDELKEYREKYHSKNLECATISSKAKGENKFQILYSFCLTIGGLVFGISFTSNDDVKTTLFVGSLVLIVIGAILSFFVNKNDAN